MNLSMKTEFNPRAQATTSLNRLATLVFQKDPAIFDEFCDDALLVGPTNPPGGPLSSDR